MTFLNWKYLQQTANSTQVQQLYIYFKNVLYGNSNKG